MAEFKYNLIVVGRLFIHKHHFMKHFFTIIVLILSVYTTNGQNPTSESTSKHLLLFNMGAGQDIYDNNEFDCVKKWSTPFEFSYNYLYKKNVLIGFLFSGENRSLDSTKILKNIDVPSPANHREIIMKSTQRYFSSGYFGPTISYFENRDKLKFITTFSTGLFVGSKHGVYLYSAPYDTLQYSYKHMECGKVKSAVGFYSGISTKIGIEVYDNIFVDLNYSINYFNANFNSSYSEKTNKMTDFETVFYKENIHMFRHYLGIGVGFFIGNN